MKVKYMLSQPGWVHTLNTSTKQIFDENHNTCTYFFSPDSNPMSFIFYDFFFHQELFPI